MTKGIEAAVVLNAAEPLVQEQAPELERGTPAAEGQGQAMVEAGDVQPGTRGLFSAASRQDDAGRLDAAAGCEFVDDRIHLLE